MAPEIAENAANPPILPPVAPGRSKAGWWVALVLLAVILGGSAIYGAMWVRHRWTHSISDDAFVDSHLVNVAPEVAGTIVEVRVQEQQRVKRGEVLAIVDPTVYRRAVELAAARVEVAQAALAKAESDLALVTAEVPRQVAIAELRLAIQQEDQASADEDLRRVSGDVVNAISAASHAVDGAHAAFTLSEEDYRRYSALFQDQSIPLRKFEEATKIYRTAKADLEVARARLGQAEANRNEVAMARQRLLAARHASAASTEQVALAKLGDLRIASAARLVEQRRQDVALALRARELADANLEFTSVRAPFDGVVARKWRHLGDYAAAGEPIVNVYDPELLYVTVHLEETLLEGVAPGNAVGLAVDAFATPFRGRVLWVGSATHANFSLIPRDVSAGEFTFVVQRVPTRVVFEPDDRLGQLRPGLSVTVTIEHGPGDPEWAAQAWRAQGRVAGITEEVP